MGTMKNLWGDDIFLALAKIRENDLIGLTIAKAIRARGET